eukprot:Awhi_evm1s10262
MKDDEKAKLMTALKNYTGQTTVPNIFINEEHIGGSTDLQALQDSGKLSAMLTIDECPDLSNKASIDISIEAISCLRDADKNIDVKIDL